MKNKKKKKKKSLINTLKKRFAHKKDNDWNSNTFSMFEVLIIILISILFGVIIGYIVTCSKNPLYGSDKSLTEIIDVYNNLTTDYYDNVDKDKLSDGAVKGMVESIEDPYTNYMDSNITNEFNETVKGSFVGIGVTVTYVDGYYEIIEILKDSPASKSGLKVGDLLMEVNGKDIKEDEAAFRSITKGEVGSKVKITVKRNTKMKSFTLKRAVVELETVHNKVFDYEGLNVGYVKIDAFAANSYKQFKKAMNRFDKKEIDVLVIDVRDNPGGQLDQTREILSMFFPKKTVLYQIKTKSSVKKVYSLNSSTKKYPVAILTNAGSASAAEILASCFKENYKNSIVVGDTTYGKGTIQKAQSLNSGNSIKYTTDRWLTSKGKWLDEKGLEPDVSIAASNEYYENPTYENDNQLQEALKRLKESNN